ncbi:(4Fe-4S)-binding protein [Persicitalea sp.]|uniref:(4Fe-4S)-binding protein n=1 Tax=Persicitalea sp. TaxID=3100273 RepID=UPI0035945C02
MEKRITKNYDNGEVTVVWQPHKCIHSAICFRGLPSVFDPQKRPWVNLDGADSATIVAQVEKCPSGALSYRMDGAAMLNGHATEKPGVSAASTVVDVKPNGPLLIQGELIVKDAAGNEEVKSKVTAFCRCGFSQNKPYCDGSHVREGWEG